jgi:hypothetical protein
MHKTVGGFGKSKNSDSTEDIRKYIEKVGITTRTTVLQRFYRDVDIMAMNGIEDTLRQIGAIKVELIPRSSDKTYTWIGG